MKSDERGFCYILFIFKFDLDLIVFVEIFKERFFFLFFRLGISLRDWRGFCFGGGDKKCR